MIKIYDRSVEISENERFIGFEGDNNVHTVCIEIFNKWLCDFDFKIDVMNKCKNIVEPEKEITEDGVLLAWDIKKEHLIGGILYAQVRAFSEDEQIWHSDIFELKTKKSINATKAFASPLPTEFEVIEKNITKAKNEAMAAAEKAEAAAESITGGQIIDESNLVHKDGDEEISGNKTFSGDVILNRIGAIMPEGGDGSGYIRLEAGNIAEAYAALGIYSGAKIEAYLDYDAMSEEDDGNRLALSGKVLINGKEAAVKEDIENIVTPEIDESNLVHKTDDEEISGVKNFKDKIIVKEISSYNQLKITGDGVDISAESPVYFESTGNDANIKAATEINLNAPKVLVNNKEVATKDDIPESPKIDESNLVHKTDDEEISGNKKFTGKVDINRIETEEGIYIYGGDAGVYFGGNADSLFMRFGAEFRLGGDLTVNGKVVAMKEDITTAIGDVETALDNIIAIQNSLIGGDGV